MSSPIDMVGKMKEALIKGQSKRSPVGRVVIKPMSLERAITLLKDRAEKGECDGECDEGKPYNKCKECAAASILNEINDIVRGAL